MKRCWCTLAALALSCTADSAKSGAAELRSGLRVPVPDGWKATPNAGGLQVGPAGRAILQLESTDRTLPQLENLVAALEGERVEILKKESISTFVGVTYSLQHETSKLMAFLGVRQTGPRTIWCSTSGNALPEEVDAALTICRSLSWEG